MEGSQPEGGVTQIQVEVETQGGSALGTSYQISLTFSFLKRIIEYLLGILHLPTHDLI